jgi:hypothetical protein
MQWKSTAASRDRLTGKIGFILKGGHTMTKKVGAILGVLLFCGVMISQEPVLNIDAKVHPNLYAAQRDVVDASHLIHVAQKDNRYDMHGHATRARQLLVEVNQELKLAAEDANAGMHR